MKSKKKKNAKKDFQKVKLKVGKFWLHKCFKTFEY